MWESGGIALEFLTLAPDESQWSASSPCSFTSEETALVAIIQEKASYPLATRGSIPRCKADEA
jgi:hypothetical protein